MQYDPTTQPYDEPSRHAEIDCCNSKDDPYILCECAKCQKWEDWLRTLNEDVLQGEYGYEEGEFTVFPTLWRYLYDKGMTPTDAFELVLLNGWKNEDEIAKTVDPLP